MTGAAELVMALCAGALIFSLLRFLIPEEGAGRAVQVAASAFLLLVVVRCVTGFAKTVSSLDLSGEKQTVDVYVTDKLVEQQAEMALAEVARDRLNTAGCRFTAVTATVTYGDEGFGQVGIAVTVTDPVEGERAKETLSDWEIPVTITMEGEDTDG